MTQTKQPVKTTTAVEKVADDEKVISYVPLGGADPLKLSVNIVLKFLCTPTTSGRLCSERDAMRYLMLCSAKRLNPWDGDAFLVGYDSSDGPVFSQITAHQAFTKRAEFHPEFDGYESGVVVRDGEDGPIIDQPGDFIAPGQTLLGGWARVTFKTRKIPLYRRLNLDAKIKKTNQGKVTRFWADDTGGMIVKCAEADALRSAFPTMLGGLYTQEELDLRGRPTVDVESTKPTFTPLPAPADDATLTKAEPKPEPVKKATTVPLPQPTGLLFRLYAQMEERGVTDAQMIATLKRKGLIGANAAVNEVRDIDDLLLKELEGEWDILTTQAHIDAKGAAGTKELALT